MALVQSAQGGNKTHYFALFSGKILSYFIFGGKYLQRKSYYKFW